MSKATRTNTINTNIRNKTLPSSITPPIHADTIEVLNQDLEDGGNKFEDLLANFPAVGKEGVVYVDTTNNSQYRWDSNLVTYVQLGGGESNVLTSNSNLIEFENRTIYGTNLAPLTTAITFDFTNAKLGVIQKLYHNSASLNYPIEGVLIGDGVYEPSTLNIIYLEYVSNSRVEIWITTEQ